MTSADLIAQAREWLNGEPLQRIDEDTLVAALAAALEAVEAERDRLREALSRIAVETHPDTTLNFREAIEVARAALKAGSCE